MSFSNTLNHGACTRRDFLRLGISGAVAMALTSRLAFAEEAAGKKIPVGVQLYSVREACAKDLPGTLKSIKKIGYSGVEYAGYYGKTAKELRKMMDDEGLKCYGTHTGLETLRGDELKKSIEFNQILGNRYLICPWMQARNADEWKALADEFNKMSEIVAKEKVGDKRMYVGYHAHAHDFDKFGEKRAWDIFFGGTVDDVVMQLDTSNCLAGGADPIAVLKQYPKRGLTIHLKEHGGSSDSAIGEGEVKWAEVFKLCEENKVTEYYIVESEKGANPEASINDVRRCFEGLKKMKRV